MAMLVVHDPSPTHNGPSPPRGPSGGKDPPVSNTSKPNPSTASSSIDDDSPIAVSPKVPSRRRRLGLVAVAVAAVVALVGTPVVAGLSGGDDNSETSTAAAEKTELAFSELVTALRATSTSTSTTAAPTTTTTVPLDPMALFFGWYNSLDAQGLANWEQWMNPPPPPPAPAPAPAPAPEPVYESAPAPAVSGDSVWDALAQCESGGNWSINTGNGFYGGIQFMHQTWVNMGGRQYAEYPHEASREQQIEVATRLQAQYGWGQWPACTSKLGLR